MLELCARGWLGEQGKHRAGMHMWARMVAEELCAHLAKSLVDDPEQDVRLNVREPGFRAQLPR